MADFCANLWIEDPTPDHLRGCNECGRDQHGSRMVWGEGNPEARIIVILDNPRAREEREGNSFVCGTRATLQQAANEVGLRMNDLYVTYILKRKPSRAYDKEHVREICMIHLDEQLKTNSPTVVLCLGNVVVQSFFQDLDVDVKSLRGQESDVRGYQTMVAYHPLAIRRRPNLKRLFDEDWEWVVNYLKS